jgi:hypothetical protein
MIFRREGVWTQQDIHDFEDGIGMWRFAIRGNTVRVQHPREENTCPANTVMSRPASPVSGETPSHTGGVAHDAATPFLQP